MLQDTQKLLFALSLGFAGLLVLPHMAQAAGPQCGPRDAVLQELSQRYGEARHSIGLAGNGNVVETYAHPQKGTWTILVTLPNGSTCMVASGQSFEVLNELSGEKV